MDRNCHRNATSCCHGYLARACNLCERDAELADLRTRLAETERDLHELKRGYGCLSCEKLAIRLAEAEKRAERAERAAGRSVMDGVIQKARADLAEKRLGEAVALLRDAIPSIGSPLHNEELWASARAFLAELAEGGR